MLLEEYKCRPENFQNFATLLSPIQTYRKGDCILPNIFFRPRFEWINNKTLWRLLFIPPIHASLHSTLKKYSRLLIFNIHREIWAELLHQVWKSVNNLFYFFIKRGEKCLKTKDRWKMVAIGNSQNQDVQNESSRWVVYN